MKTSPATASACLALSMMLTACSGEAERPSAQDAPTKASADSQAARPTAPVPSTGVIGLEGLDALRVGQSAPVGTSWATRGAQIEGSCQTLSSPDYPGAYALLSDGQIRRITVGQRSDIKLAEGIGVGSSEQDVQRWFAGFRAEPHKYEDAPAKYLTAPNAGDGSALRFEIGQDGKVKIFHVGLMPELAYVEGCG